ncbi:MAG: OadG family protein [Candidatus Izemoplasmatales bacterium]
MFLAIQYPFLQGLMVSVVCVLIVFAMLELITLVVGGIRNLIREEPADGPEPPAAPIQAKPFGPEDLKDDDMVAAVLVAAIDFRESTKQEPNVVSVKEIRS